MLSEASVGNGGLTIQTTFYDFCTIAGGLAKGREVTLEQ
jgi:hypothetical protein